MSQTVSPTLKMIARFDALPNQLEPLRETLIGLIEPTRREVGCLRYELWHNREDPSELTFVEEWQSDAHLAAHLETPHIKALFVRLQELEVPKPQVLKYVGILDKERQ